ncbi:phosphoribosylformylglycinamidine synthase [Algoriphagus sp. H41]|uniref:Phosphoribosylformylglycinamidine synthase n=1 Tax=Algoriphagus oliviformis TaxID=2811231 RepID=A0ABS3C8J2_9BACT|nr:HAEPLYID family protein [Algoriphagus oliviformis]MBN7811914.1 phosphoribosylformylglycinamidine synthase [Algoriphagus oliviformis]
MKKILLLTLAGWAHLCAYAQENSDTLRIQRQQLDSLFIDEMEQPTIALRPKVLHAEPLYIDLIRDLGARKGEKEWNVAFGMQDMRKYDEFQALVEYEWAPLDRLGLEVELPFSLYSFRDGSTEASAPANRLESLKVATQYTFLVSERLNTSLALGYIHEFELVDLKKLGKEDAFKGNIFNPFLVAAKRWGSNYHTLIYTGPKIEKAYGEKADVGFEVNYNFHYMVSGTRNFLGLEVNQEIHGGKSTTTLRPQMRVGLAHNLMIGIVSAIPVSQPDAGLGSFLRIIYEPGFRAVH